MDKAINKQRAGKLIAWGVAVEQLLADDTLLETGNANECCLGGR